MAIEMQAPLYYVKMYIPTVDGLHGTNNLENYTGKKAASG